MKGSILDPIFTIIIIFGLLASSVIAWYCLGIFKTVIRSQLVNQSVPQESLDVIDSIDTVKTVFNNMILLVIFSLMAVVLVISFLVRFHPIFLFVAILTYAASILVVVALKTSWDRIVESIPALATELTAVSWFFNNILVIFVVFMAFNIVLMYKGITSPEGSS